ncbi:DUF4215 domain-containing protein [Candidatus Woesearchaeota archaeon]|nr:DUF4215 domain-containing protein [Candidatus Woesearchaeota archaeon]
MVFFKVFDSVNKQLVTIEPQPATFSKSTTTITASSQWTGEYYASSLNKYYFQATVTGGKAHIQLQSPSDKLLTVTKAPSAVCGNGIVEGSNNEECDDGNTNDTDDCSNTCKRKRYAGGRSCQDDPLCIPGAPATYMVCKSDVTQSYFCITGSGGCKQLSIPLPCGKVGGVQKICVKGADSCRSPTCSYNYPVTPCVNGQQQKQCVATPAGASHCSCAGYPQTISCQMPHEEEPFPVFTWGNVLVTILLLITFYTFRRGVRWKSR